MTRAAIQVDTAVYGTKSCPLTRGIREWLGEHDIPYDFYDIESDEGAEERVRRMNGGKLKYPMVTVGDRVMKNPSDDELREALEASDVEVSDREPDMGVRGALDRSASGAPAAGKAVRDMFSTDEIFQRITATADEEFSRSNRLLFLSGLAAGLSIGLTFLARAALTGLTPGDSSGLVGNLLYPVGFLLIVMGRYQLFTENTLTPVTLVLTRIASLPTLLRVWGVVLLANVLGAALVALVLATTGVLTPEGAQAARGFALHGLETPWWDLFWKGLFAGWVVASMVWLTHAARDSVTRFLTVFVLMFLIPSADLFHCIIGSSEALYLVFQGEASLAASAFGFFLPVLLGNTLGGVLLVGILNYSQTRDVRYPDRDCSTLELSWKEWLLGDHKGKPGALRRSPSSGD